MLDLSNVSQNRRDGFAHHYAKFANQYRHECEGFRAEGQKVGSSGQTIMRVKQDGHEKKVPGNSDIVFRLVTGGKLEQSSVDIGDGRIPLSGRTGTLYVAPANTDAYWQSDGEHELVMLAVPEQKMRELVSLETGESRDDPLRTLYGRDIIDGAAANFMDTIWRQGKKDLPGCALIADGLLSAFLGTLLGLTEKKESTTNPPLDQARLNRVIDYVDAHMELALRVDDLANVAGLSSFHFSRRFKASTGSTPHTFIIERRVAAAQLLLEEGKKCLAEIAYECGFGSQSHFTTSFKYVHGITPGQYRRDFLS